MSNTELGPAIRPVHVAAGEGEAIWAMSSLFQIKLDGAASGGGLAVMEVVQPPGVATPLHVHHREAEAFFLLEGTMTYEAAGALHHLERGSFMSPEGGSAPVPRHGNLTGSVPGAGHPGGGRGSVPVGRGPGRRTPVARAVP